MKIILIIYFLIASLNALFSFKDKKASAKAQLPFYSEQTRTIIAYITVALGTILNLAILLGVIFKF